MDIITHLKQKTDEDNQEIVIKWSKFDSVTSFRNRKFVNSESIVIVGQECLTTAFE